MAVDDRWPNRVDHLAQGSGPREQAKAVRIWQPMEQHAAGGHDVIDDAWHRAVATCCDVDFDAGLAQPTSQQADHRLHPPVPASERTSSTVDAWSTT